MTKHLKTHPETLNRDKIILLARERAFKHFKEVDDWEKDNTLIKFILRGFRYTQSPQP